MKNALIFCCILFIQQSGLGQNLVPNPGFEYCRIPINDWMLTNTMFDEYMINWFSPNSGSPDILQKNELGRMRHVRPNVNIESYSPRSGNVMIGLKLYGCEDGDHCKEYLQIKLKEKLQSGKRYYFEVWTKPIRSSIKISNIGILFSIHKIERYGTNMYDRQPMINVDSLLNNSSTNEWIKVSDTICADSSYQYLAIGNFHPDGQTANAIDSNGINYAYYLFDDVQLLETQRICNGITVASIMNTKNIQFETNSSKLQSGSFLELSKLIAFLKDNPDKRISIEGHTDNIGTAAYNQKLSQNRANAVLQHLVIKGISKDRLMAIGKGTSTPITTNSSEEGRRTNRRVEIIIIN